MRPRHPLDEGTFDQTDHLGRLLSGFIGEEIVGVKFADGLTELCLDQFEGPFFHREEER